MESSVEFNFWPSLLRKASIHYSPSMMVKYYGRLSSCACDGNHLWKILNSKMFQKVTGHHYTFFSRNIGISQIIKTKYVKNYDRKRHGLKKRKNEYQYGLSNIFLSQFIYFLFSILFHLYLLSHYIKAYDQITEVKQRQAQSLHV